MKKLFVIAIVSLALGACGGKKKEETTPDKGGNMGETGGQTYGATTPTTDTPANPCGGAANPCAPK